MLTVLPPSVVLTAHAGHDVEELDVAAPVGVAVAFTVCCRETNHTEDKKVSYPVTGLV